MKRRHRAIGKPTKSEQAHQDRQRELGCAMCNLLELRIACGPTEIHHRTIGDLHGNPQLGHDCTVALGAWHHRGAILPSYTGETMRMAFGPSLASHKRAFLDLLWESLGVRSTEALQAWQDAQLEEAA